MSKKVLVCGSYAFDSIMVFEDQFKNHILPDKVHMLNISFLVPKMRKEFGGCAGNIAYSLNLLGADVLPMATVGEDFPPYGEWLKKNNIDSTFIKVVDGTYTGQAFITTDMDDNQITAFHPGAMGESHLNSVNDTSDIALGIVSPDGKQGMIEHAKQFSDAKIPFIFDPGQGMPMFNKDELLTFIEQANYITLNDYESQLLQDKTGLQMNEIASQVDAYIVTKGSEGSEIYANGEVIKIEPAKTSIAQDPTGCGDAYRAGLIFGMINEFGWKTCGQLAGLIGAIKIEHLGTQNHSFTLEEIKILYHQQFNEELF